MEKYALYQGLEFQLSLQTTAAGKSFLQKVSGS